MIEHDLRQHQRIRHLRPVATFVEVIDIHRIPFSPKLREIMRSADQLDYLFIPFWGMLGTDLDEIVSLIEMFHRHRIELNCPKFWLHYESRSWKVELSRFLHSRNIH